MDEQAGAEGPQEARRLPADAPEAQEADGPSAQRLGSGAFEVQPLVDAVRRAPQRLAVGVHPAGGHQQERDRQLRDEMGHRPGGVRDHEPLEERPREARLHLAAAVGDEAEPGRESQELLAEPRAVPGRDEGVGVGQEAAQAGRHTTVGDAGPVEAAAEAALARSVEEGAEEGLSGEDDDSRALHMTLTSPLPGRGGVADEQEDDGRAEERDDARHEEDRGEGEAVGDDADQVGRADRADAGGRCPTCRRPTRPLGSGRGRRAASRAMVDIAA